MATAAEIAASQAAYNSWDRGAFFHVYQAVFGASQATALDMASWIAVAQSFGAKYAYITAVHASGYPIYNSASTTPNYYTDYGVDLVAMFFTLCRAAGIVPCIYHGGDGNPSHTTFRNTMATHLTELAAYYTPSEIGVIWMDPVDSTWMATMRTAVEVTASRPKILLANNVAWNGTALSCNAPGGSYDATKSDVALMEDAVKSVQDQYYNNYPGSLPTWAAAEELVSLGFTNFALAGTGTFIQPDWSAPVRDMHSIGFLRTFASLCDAFGVNFVLNIPPNQDGTISPRIQDRVRQFSRNATRIGVSRKSNTTASSCGSHATQVSGASGFAFGPQIILDGSYGPGSHQWYTENTSELPWWKVDLGQDYPIESLFLVGGATDRRDCDIVFELIDSAGNTVWRSDVVNASSFHAGAADISFAFAGADPMGVTARYVKFTKATAASVAIASGDGYTTMNWTQFYIWSQTPPVFRANVPSVAISAANAPYYSGEIVLNTANGLYYASNGTSWVLL